MANIFQIKRSSVAGKQPNVADLQVGELAINLADGVIYSKNTAGNIIVVGSSTTSNVEEGTNLYFTNTRAIGAFTSGSGISIEGNGLISSTVTGGGAGANVTVSSSPPNSPDVGDIWIDSETADYFTYIDDGNSSQWVEIAASTVYVSQTSSSSGVLEVNGLTGNVTLVTANISEDTNLYFTNTRAISAFTAGSGIVLGSNGLITANVSGGGGAVDLSSVSSNIVPDADVTYDLGTATNRWRDLYLSGNTINLGGAQLKSDAETGAVLIVPTPTAEVPNPKATLVSPTGSITAVETEGGVVSSNTIAEASASTSDAIGKAIAMSIVFGG